MREGTTTEPGESGPVCAGRWRRTETQIPRVAAGAAVAAWAAATTPQPAMVAAASRRSRPVVTAITADAHRHPRPDRAGWYRPVHKRKLRTLPHNRATRWVCQSPGSGATPLRYSSGPDSDSPLPSRDVGLPRPGRQPLQPPDRSPGQSSGGGGASPVPRRGWEPPPRPGRFAAALSLEENC